MPQLRETVALESPRGLLRGPVPRVARGVLLEARARVDDEQGLHPLRVHAVERQRHVAAEREAADDGLAAAADVVEQSRHVGDGVGFAVEIRVGRVVGLAVAAHVPGDEREAFRERRDLRGPHGGGGGVAVREEEGRAAAAVDFVVEAHAVAGEVWHFEVIG